MVTYIIYALAFLGGLALLGLISNLFDEEYEED